MSTPEQLSAKEYLVPEKRHEGCTRIVVAKRRNPKT